MDPDFLVFSDGSGREKNNDGSEDGIGGWAALACNAHKSHKLFRMAAVRGGTVDQMEMEGMLNGLRLAWMLFEKYGIVGLRSRAPIVFLYMDRESIVLAIEKIYQRSNCLELWAQFDWYSSRMIIKAIHVSRETDFPEFQEVDLQASTGRIIMKSYTDNTQFLGNSML